MDVIVLNWSINNNYLSSSSRCISQNVLYERVMSERKGTLQRSSAPGKLRALTVSTNYLEFFMSLCKGFPTANSKEVWKVRRYCGVFKSMPTAKYMKGFWAGRSEHIPGINKLTLLRLYCYWYAAVETPDLGLKPSIKDFIKIEYEHFPSKFNV